MDARAQPANDPDAARVLAGALQAHGGGQALAAARDVRITGLFRVPQPDGKEETHSARIWVQGSLKMRIETTGPAGKRLYVTDGEVAWVVDGEGKRFLTKEEAGNRLVEINPSIGLVRAIAAGGLTSKYRGPVQRDGMTLENVSATLPDSTQSPPRVDREYEVLVDPATSLVESIAFDARTPGGPQPDSRERYVYSDYRRTLGLMVPFRIDHYLNERLLSVFLVDAVEAVQRQDSLFLQP